MKPTSSSRFAHWVLKIGNLKDSLRFFEGVLGLRVLRHEEFSEGCEATCNGPYAGAWSKTMVGYGPERENFALELTYNYGIESYESGNDLQYIALSCPFALERAKYFGYSIETDIVSSPDGYRFKIVPSVQSRAEKFDHISIRVSNLSTSQSYWGSLLGLNKISEDQHSATYSFGKNQVCLKLDQSSHSGESVEHALSGGRAAFACKTGTVPCIHSMVAEAIEKNSKASGSILTPPLTLPTPGKADVVVTILADPDDYEICFVEDEAFYELATPTYDVVDWVMRASKGGDGAPLLKEKLEHGPTMCSILTEEELDDLCKTAGNRSILLEFGAGWCKNCKKLGPIFEKLANENSEKLIVAAVDIDEAQELADAYGVTAVPKVVLLKGDAGKKSKVLEMSGPSKEQLLTEVTSAIA